MTMGIEGLPPEKAIHSSTAPIMAPATGVQRPARSSIPAHAAIMCGTVDGRCELPLRCPAKWQSKTNAANNR